MFHKPFLSKSIIYYIKNNKKSKKKQFLTTISFLTFLNY